MHRYTAVAAAVCVWVAMCGASALAEEPVDLSGAWTVTIELPQGKVSFDALVTQMGERVTCQLDSPAGKLEFAGTLVRANLTATYAVPFQGKTVEFKLTGTVRDGVLSGTIDLLGTAQFPWTGVRKPETQSPPAGQQSGTSEKPADPPSTVQ